jgi:xanthine dehydrogenase accessory factor
MKELENIVRALLSPNAGASVLATLVTVEGSSYRRPGARLLLQENGIRTGSISGGCLEEDVLARAREVAKTQRAEGVVYDTTSENDLVWGVGLGCHGVVRVLIEPLPQRPLWALALAENFAAGRSTELAVVHHHPDQGQLGSRLGAPSPGSDASKVFFETIPPPTSIVIFGAGDDAQPLARFAHELGWRITVADPRAAFATQERFPVADRVIAAPAAELVARTAPSSDAIAVVMTHHYVHDVPLLRALLPRPLAYLGLLGPRKRAERILADLARENFAINAEQRERLHAPIGLDIGANTPEQVALAIVAEIQTVLGGRDARPLRERSRPIHA